jgi:hypothetical protein
MTGGVFGGCGHLFKPATPEAPTEKPVVLHYETVELTLKTMENGIAAKAGGVDAWLGAFDPTSYQQVFDPDDVSHCGCQAPTEWGYLAEQSAYLYLIGFRPADSYSLAFSAWPEAGAEPVATPDEATIFRRYQIVANSPDGNSSLIVAIGTVELTLKNIGGNWLITKWIDHRDIKAAPDLETMGTRRLESTTGQ